MTDYTVYDLETKEILRTGQSSNPKAQARAGQGIAFGRGDGETQTVDDSGPEPVLVGKPVEDVAAARDAKLWKSLRARRAALLANELDTINAVRWDAMSEPERRAWRGYRQALLDLPQNTPDPRNPVWPEKPE